MHGLLLIVSTNYLVRIRVDELCRGFECILICGRRRSGNIVCRAQLDVGPREIVTDSVELKRQRGDMHVVDKDGRI